MKKIVKLSLLVLVLVYCTIGNVYAALSCNADIVLPETEISKNEEFTVDFILTDVQADRGIVALGATLEYDKNSLEIVKTEGKNGWDTPGAGSFNRENGKMALTRNSNGTSDETVFTITFKVKDTSESKIPVSFKDIVIADGHDPVKISVISKEINVNTTQNPDDKPGDDDSKPNKPDDNKDDDNNNNNSNDNNSDDKNNPNNDSNSASQDNTNNGNNNNNNSNKPNKDSLANLILPYTGRSGIAFIILIGAAGIFATIFYFRARMSNKEK